jgi:hypothetical protein
MTANRPVRSHVLYFWLGNAGLICDQQYQTGPDADARLTKITENIDAITPPDNCISDISVITSDVQDVSFPATSSVDV